ncbi:alpha/beta hydrolase [Actinoalloteichus hymeniacidonis]|uniref:Lysophospholipase n=1 Tax=Actinoalloteichus hymeniacidonis TaxID=340345 RepID=A0AAC9N0Z9_9PSEU|nr:alpha/beta hydrolase [Actinoalloteichus hymeniacidonis]AOS65612.1 lysophospholipase [Actinoalloteichus hymeniacidonis]MBB5906298.1 pimeloyl-ACP methyl ester carboxylesterase [Actinoalloteichus hymeniacidonis]
MPRMKDVGIVLAAVAVAAAVPLVANLGAAPGPTAGAQQISDETRAQAAEATARRLADADIVDLAVEFTVRDVNRSATPCTPTDETYTVRGHLTAPESVLAEEDPQVTLYQHDLSANEWYWRLDVPGYHHAEELARRGHASLTIDRVGYGASDRPNGYHLCLGAQADMTDQIIGDLRAGDYRVVESTAEVVEFSSVVLAGLGTGAQIAQHAALFGNADGLVVMGWADLGRTNRFMTRFFAGLSTCMQSAGPDQQPEVDGGYAYFDVGATQYVETNFHDADPEVLAAATPLQTRHPCKEVVSQLEGISTDLRELPEVTTPVLGVYGTEDSLFQDGEEQLALFSEADTELITLPDAGHYVGLDSEPELFHDGLADWLAAR